MRQAETVMVQKRREGPCSFTTLVGEGSQRPIAALRTKAAKQSSKAKQSTAWSSCRPRVAHSHALSSAQQYQ